MRRGFAASQLVVEITSPGYKSWRHVLRNSGRFVEWAKDTAFVRACLVRQDHREVRLTLATHNGVPFNDDLTAMYIRLDSNDRMPRALPAPMIGGGIYLLDLPPGKVRLSVMPQRCLGAVDATEVLRVPRRSTLCVELRLPPAARVVVMPTAIQGSRSLLALAGRPPSMTGPPSPLEKQKRLRLWCEAARSVALDPVDDTIVHIAPGWWQLRLVRDSGVVAERTLEVLPAGEYHLQEPPARRKR
jgi:hypothetical protein